MSALPSPLQLHDPLPVAARVRGLPGRLPEGETMLWQGTPDPRALLRDAFHARLWIAYLLAILAGRAGLAAYEGRPAMDAVSTCLYGIVFGGLGLAIFGLFAWLIGRTTVYTITTRRVVISYGIALPKSVNLPFALIEAVDMGLRPDGSGNVTLRLPPKPKLSYLLLWPHARPGRRGITEPVLRCLPDARAVAALLASALTGSTVHLSSHASPPVADGFAGHAGKAAA